MECLVNKCTNAEHQGNGLYLNMTDPEFGSVGHEWICAPCFDALIGVKDARFTQVFRNMKEQFFRSSHHEVEKYYEDDYNDEKEN